MFPLDMAGFYECWIASFPNYGVCYRKFHLHDVKNASVSRSMRTQDELLNVILLFAV